MAEKLCRDMSWRSDDFVLMVKVASASLGWLKGCHELGAPAIPTLQHHTFGRRKQERRAAIVLFMAQASRVSGADVSFSVAILWKSCLTLSFVQRPSEQGTATAVLLDQAACSCSSDVCLDSP